MRRLPILLIAGALLSAGCSVVPAVRTLADGPPVVGQVYCQQNGFLGIYEFATRVYTSFEVSETAIDDLAGKSLVGATIGARLRDGMVSSVNVRQRDHFVPVPYDSRCNRVEESTAAASRSFESIDFGGLLGGSGLPPVATAIIQYLMDQLCEARR